jgi:hypothetical protein
MLSSRGHSGGHEQKCRFRLRKPSFYPLNYGDVGFLIFDSRFSIVQRNW